MRQILAVTSVAMAVTVLSAQELTQRQPPVFRAAVDSVALEVQVLDRDGLPIRGLTAEAFTVSLDRRERPVQSATWFEYTDAAGAPSPVRPLMSPPTSVASTSAVPQGRVIFLAIDEHSMNEQAMMASLADARRFSNLLLPEDYLGLVGFPTGRTYINPTRDRARVHSALTPALRQDVIKSGAFHFRPSEIVDITAGDAQVIGEVEERECPKVGRQTCRDQVRAEARILAAQHEASARQRLNALTALFDALAAVPGRKIVVVISGGLLVSDRTSGRPDVVKYAWEVGRAATRANVALYVLHQDDQFLDSMSVRHGRSAQPSSIRDSSLQSAGLGAIAGTAGGHLADISAGTARDAFARVMREVSGFYVLGVGTEARDRDGRPKVVDVKVTAPGAKVRFRESVVIAKSPGS